MPETRRSTIVFALTGVILLALGIRTGVAAIAPLAPSMDLDLAMEGLPLGIIGTIPPIAYALAAWFAPWLAQKVGLETAAIAVGVLGALAHVWRGVSPTFLSLFAATAVLMVAAGVGNVILPGLVKLYAPHAIGSVTAAYGTAMAVSSSAPSFLRSVDGRPCGVACLSRCVGHYQHRGRDSLALGVALCETSRPG